MINISDRDTLRTILHQLTPSANALWGKMSPQHAIEHLTISIQVSAGKNGRTSNYARRRRED